jgi:hypothetical protein
LDHSGAARAVSGLSVRQPQAQPARVAGESLRNLIRSETDGAQQACYELSLGTIEAADTVRRPAVRSFKLRGEHDESA